MTFAKKNPAGGRGSDTLPSGQTYPAQIASAEPLLQRLEGVQKAGSGWRSMCPACGGRSRKLSVTQRDDRVLVHCFAGCAAADVIAAVGVAWADLHPPKHWPQSPEERRRARRAIREAGWSAALDVLAYDATLVRIAAEHTAHGIALSGPDLTAVYEASERIGNAAVMLVEGRNHG